MIPATQARWQSGSWQQQLSEVIRDADQLMELLALDPARSPVAEAALRQFPLRVPHAFARRMRRGDWHDPLLLQVLPSRRELLDPPGFSPDPLAERDANPAPGLVHKYRNRVLLITSPACAINCRYCFRRHFPYQENTPGRRYWRAALEYIAADERIDEVILSGGDPLVATDRYLADLCRALADIPHLRRLRVHTRLPVVIPDRITDETLRWLTGTRLQPVVALHSNHANELDDTVAAAAARLRAAGIPLLNQTVLLRDINDDAQALAELSHRLFEIGIMPYYLHLLDRVAGAGHFEVEDSRADELYRDLLHSLSGYLVPRLVREEAGGASKTPVALAT